MDPYVNTRQQVLLNFGSTNYFLCRDYFGLTYVVIEMLGGEWYQNTSDLKSEISNISHLRKNL